MVDRAGDDEGAPMITMIGIGIAFLFVLAIGVRVVEVAPAPRRRRLAAERRERWEARTRPASDPATR
jgi:hypothetical protein